VRRHRTLIVIGAVFGVALVRPRAVALPSADINLSAFANGALVESSTSDYFNGWEARWITDEDPKIGWSTARGVKAPFTIVISLPERSEIHAVEFDAASTESPARTAKDIDVAISDVSATAGFAPLTSVSLKPGADKQSFPIATPGAGRWIKLTIKTNHGDADYTQFMEFRAIGSPLTQTPAPANLSGTYESNQYGKFHLQQNGASLAGCYEHSEGLFQGGAESHLMRLTWRERTESGPAIMVLKRDGKSFEGWWAYKDSPQWHPNWDLKKIADVVGTCPNWNPKGASGNLVASELTSSGRVRLYGINFDVDSDHLRADARPTIDQLIEALKANPTWNISIEGHTDSTGDAAHNLTLSQLRANAVKAALVAGGIATDRLTTAGLGQTKPVASNDSEVGRAQNRRVEVVKK
jgi:outer membrane protein OmpA-like peptidoglycan-associated protein